MEKLQKFINTQYEHVILEIDRLNSKIARVEEKQESMKYSQNTNEVKLENNYDIIQYIRSIEMIQDKYNHLSTQFDKLKYSLDSKVCQEDFIQYTTKVAQEYATLSMLDLSIKSIETKSYVQDDQLMKNSMVKSRVKYLNKQTQVFEYQHSIEQQVEERLLRFTELITSQVRQLCDQVQAFDISKPFREQVQNNINNFQQKLHQLELFQVEIQRHLEVREYEKLVKQFHQIDERIQMIENSNQGLKNLITTISEQKRKKQKQKEIEKIKQYEMQMQMNKQNQIQVLEKQYLSVEEFESFQKQLSNIYLSKLSGTQLLQRVNEAEDNMKLLLNKEIFDKLVNEINDIDEKFGIVLQNLSNKFTKDIQQLNEKYKSLEDSMKSSITRSEIIQILDNPQAMMKVNSSVQNIQEKFKELYQKQIDIIEQSLKFSLNNLQAANITQNEQVNQYNLLLKKCDQNKQSLFEYFGQNINTLNQRKKQEVFYQQCINQKIQPQTEKNSQQEKLQIQERHNQEIKQNRPLSVGSKNARPRRYSATPKILSSSFSGSAVETQFFQRVIQNPLIQKLKK